MGNGWLLPVRYFLRPWASCAAAKTWQAMPRASGSPPSASTALSRVGLSRRVGVEEAPGHSRQGGPCDRRRTKNEHVSAPRAVCWASCNEKGGAGRRSGPGMTGGGSPVGSSGGARHDRPGRRGPARRRID